MGKKRRNRIILGIGVGILVALIVAGYFPKGYFLSGFGGTHNHKTLWDWLSLAGVVAVPLVLAWFGFRLQLQQQQQTKEQLETERDIAEQNRQEEALQNYYDKVSALLVDKNLLAIAAKRELLVIDAKPDTAKPEERELLDVSVDVIRARTLTTLRKLDSSRKTSLIRFLLESEVITKLKLSLEGADLEGADLSKGNLEGANLSHTNLKGANLNLAKLEGANLSHVILEGANLNLADLQGANLCPARMEGANLRRAILKEADLRFAILKGADLRLADLEGANLHVAKLEGANLAFAELEGAKLIDVNLKGADISRARGLSKEQLEGEFPPYLCHTKLPEGIDIDPNRDCERLELLALANLKRDRKGQRQD